MSKSRFTEIEELKQKINMAQQLAKKDPEFADYAGMETENALDLARLRVIRKWFPKLMGHDLSEKTKQGLDFIEDMWLRQGKAFFASTLGSGEISHLGFRLGDRRNVIRGLKSKDDMEI